MQGKVSRLADPSALQLVHTARTAQVCRCSYVFNAVDGRGFIIVAADDKVSPVIGYSYDAGYDAADVPPTATSMLSAVLPRFPPHLLAQASAHYGTCRKQVPERRT